MNDKHPTIDEICDKFSGHINEPENELPYWHFCDNQHDADECAKLVLGGVKQATSPSLWWYEANKEPLPEVGDFNIVTNWAGEAVCIIETTDVEVVPFNRITKDYAELEGEGDKSLSYWKKVHWNYYHRELESTSLTPSESMPIVCEKFRVAFSL